MFRLLQLRPIVGQTRSVLCKVRPINVVYQVCPISRTPSLLTGRFVRPRDPCPQPDDEKRGTKEDTLLWATIASLVVGGFFIVYAKQTPELRDWLTIHAPWLDDIIAIAFEENKSYGEFIHDSIMDLKKMYLDLVTEKEVPEECKPTEVRAPVCPPKTPKEAKKEEPAKPEILQLDLCDVERCLKELSENAINNLMTARDAYILYNKDVIDTMTIFTLAKLKALRGAKVERDNLVKEHMGNANKLTAKLDELTHYFECSSGPQPIIDSIKKLVQYNQEQIKIIRKEFECEQDRAFVLDDMWMLSAKLIEGYVDEMEAFYPELTYDSPVPRINGNGDIAIYHSNRYVKTLWKGLDDALTTMGERIDRAVESLPEKGKKERESNMNALVYKKKSEVSTEFYARVEKQRAENEAILKGILDRKQKRFEASLDSKIAAKEVELNKKLQQMVDEAVLSERKAMKKELDEMSQNVQRIQNTLDQKLKAERESRRSQELWSAATALLLATQRGDPIVCVNKELAAIEKAAGCDGSNTYPADKMVQTVLKAIPKDVRDFGLTPESVLRERYPTMEQTALDVAMIEAEGAPLPMYVISWVQSLFLFMKLSSIPQEEMVLKPNEEPSNELDTFDLLQRARYWIRENNIPYAMRYVGALTGASRGAANVWYESAKAYMETRQAAEAIIAYAKALGVQHL